MNMYRSVEAVYILFLTAICHSSFVSVSETVMAFVCGLFCKNTIVQVKIILTSCEIQCTGKQLAY
jgi:hypothetical protein